MSNLAEQIREALSMFARNGIQPALNVRIAEGLDLLYAHHPLARRLLNEASERETPMDRLRVISVEGLIGFKLQGFVNDATRTRDLDDIRALLKINHATLDVDELRKYFDLFNKPELLNELLG